MASVSGSVSESDIDVQLLLLWTECVFVWCSEAESRGVKRKQPDDETD